MVFQSYVCRLPVRNAVSGGLTVAYQPHGLIFPQNIGKNTVLSDIM